MKTNPTVEKIRQLAAQIGFDMVGFTSLTSMERGEKALQDWVSDGKHGEMRYLENFSERKARMLAAIPDAKTVICLGVNYFSKAPSAERKGNQLECDLRHAPCAMRPAFAGRVARYAWGKDYHQVIKERHRKLIEQLTQDLGSHFRALSCIDIQPVPERYAAMQAGFGFFGKHTGILNARYGPWLFLSEIITNLDLPSNLPSEGDCGACVKCQKVCPTGALDEDYRLDARKCIAYWTIEHKGTIPLEMRPLIKDWIFGCDECLEVCPFTSKSKDSTWPDWKPEAGLGAWVDIAALFEIQSNSEYRKKFSGSAIVRANLKQMLRNACLVLGNSGNLAALPLLTKASQHSSEVVREHAVWALSRLHRLIA